MRSQARRRLPRTARNDAFQAAGRAAPAFIQGCPTPNMPAPAPGSCGPQSMAGRAPAARAMCCGHPKMPSVPKMPCPRRALWAAEHRYPTLSLPRIRTRMRVRTFFWWPKSGRPDLGWGREGWGRQPCVPSMRCGAQDAVVRRFTWGEFSPWPSSKVMHVRDLARVGGVATAPAAHLCAASGMHRSPAIIRDHQRASAPGENRIRPPDQADGSPFTRGVP